MRLIPDVDLEVSLSEKSLSEDMSPVSIGGRRNATDREVVSDNMDDILCKER